jgi:hemerythrin-like domain-containing protein
MARAVQALEAQPAEGGLMKPTQLLQKQHRKVIQALKQLTRGYDAALLDRVATELAAHMLIEETIFYPAAVRAKPDVVMESYEEHAIAQLALKRLLATSGRDPHFKPRAIALLELLRHHVEEEEETLLPRVEKVLEDDELDELGDTMQARFDELVDRGYESLLPSGAARTTADRESARLS